MNHYKEINFLSNLKAHKSEEYCPNNKLTFLLIINFLNVQKITKSSDNNLEYPKPKIHDK